MQTIRKGSQGTAVTEWQKILGVKADGIFGPNTEAATKEWQKEHKLVADGVVGPLTWSAAGKKVDTSNPPKTASASTDMWAYEVAKKAMPDLTEAERQYTLTVARGEGFYGKGWNPKPHPLLPNPDVNAAKTSNNWGAVQGTGSAGSFKHIDHHADGSPYVGTYKRYATPGEGYRSMAKTILGGGLRGKSGAEEIKSAINRGDLKGAVFAQHNNGYFELNPNKYFDTVSKNYRQLTSNIEWQDVLTETGHRFLDWTKWMLVTSAIGALGIGVLWMFKK